MYYPWYDDPKFISKIASKKEIIMNSLSAEKLSGRCIENYQYLVSNFLNPLSPYRSLLLYFYPGVGKTLSAITIAENFIRNDSKQKVLVITKSKTLINSFKSDLLNVCSRYTEPYQIIKNYSFITYDNFKKNKNTFTDRIVIIDEVHNLLGNTGYTTIKESIDSSKNYKLVLLSATPFYDNILPVFELSNILNGKVNQLPTSITSLLSKGYIEKVENNITSLYKNNVFELTNEGKTSVLEKLKGKIAYLKVDTSSFPKVSFPDSVNKIGNYKISMNIIPCIMEGLQERNYKEVIKNISFGALDSTLQYMSSIIYPNVSGQKVFGKQGMDYYIKGKGNTDFLLEKNIKNYSIKLYNLLQNLKKTKGKVYIHSENITDDGIPLIKACLQKNGYKVLALSSNESGISSKIEQFNDPLNDDGSWKQIILGSKIVAEGVTFKSIRQVHIYEPAWNFSSIDQFLGRAIRRGSHSTLDKKNRSVDIFLYCAILSSDMEKSIDLAKYILSTIKDRQVKLLERGISKSSFTCPLFKSRNVTKGIDGSRECEYSNCEYSCEDENIESVNTDTFNMFFHDKERFIDYSKTIEEIFTKVNQITLKDLSKKSSIDIELLQNILTKNHPLKVTLRGDIFTNKVSGNKRISSFLPKKRKEPIQISGYIKDGAFIIKIPSKVNKNKFTEKNCESFKKEDLINIAKSLNIQADTSNNKKQICLNIKNKLV